ncbi:unnamed protein product, partial [Mesorhabditis spiculigera]
MKFFKIQAPNEDLWLRLVRTPSHLQLLGPFSEVAEAYHKSMEVPEVADRVTCEIDHGLTPNMPVEDLMERLLWRHSFVRLKLKQTEPADLLHVRGSSERIIKCLLSQRRKGFTSTKRIFHLEFSALHRHGSFADDAKQGNLFWCGRHEAISASFYTAGKRFQLDFCLADFHLTRKSRNYMYSAYTSDWYLVFHKLFAHVATVDIEVAATSGPADDLWLRLLRTPSHLKLSGVVMPPKRVFGQIAAAYYKTLQVPEVADKVTVEIYRGLTPNMPVEDFMEKLLWRHNFVHLTLKQTEPEDLVHVRGSSERIIRFLLSQHRKGFASTKRIFYLEFCGLGGFFSGDAEQVYAQELFIDPLKMLIKRADIKNTLMYVESNAGWGSLFWSQGRELISAAFDRVGIGFRLKFSLADFPRLGGPLHYGYAAYTSDWYRVFHKFFAHVAAMDVEIDAITGPADDLWLRLLRTPSHLKLSGVVMPPRRAFGQIAAAYHKTLQVPEVANKVTLEIFGGLTPNMPVEDFMEKLLLRHRFVHLKLPQINQEDLLHAPESSERIIRCLLSHRRKDFASTKLIFYLEFCGLVGRFPREEAKLKVPIISSHGIGGRHYTLHAYTHDWYRIFHKLFAHVSTFDIRVRMYKVSSQDLWLRLVRTPSHLTLSGPYDAVEAEYHKSLAFPHVADKVTCKIEDGWTANIRAEDLIEKLQARHRFVHLELTQREQVDLLHVHGSIERILRFLLSQHRKGFTTTKRIFYLEFSGLGGG